MRDLCPCTRATVWNPNSPLRTWPRMWTVARSGRFVTVTTTGPPRRLRIRAVGVGSDRTEVPASRPSAPVGGTGSVLPISAGAAVVIPLRTCARLRAVSTSVSSPAALNAASALRTGPAPRDFADPSASLAASTPLSSGRCARRRAINPAAAIDAALVPPA